MKNNMKNKLWIYIPTRGRLIKQKTLKNIPKNIIPYTKLVVGKEEADSHIKLYGKDRVMISPLKGISKIRQWIMENSYSKYSLFLDDDMNFNIRKNKKLIKCNENEINDMFLLLHNWLKKDFIHVGISARQHNFCEKNDFAETTRMNNAYAYNVEKFLKSKIRFDRLQVMEDFDVTLSLLELGYNNRVTYKYAWGQGASGAKGGCSIYRTKEIQSNAAYELKKLHPNFVKIKIKNSKSIWNGINNNQRIDVNISWKKAYSEKKGNILDFLKKG